MTVFVLIAGILLLGIGSAILVSPSRMRRALGSLVNPRTLPLFAIVRIGFGIALVLASADTRLPVFVWALGLLFIVAGVSLPILGIQRHMKWADWWKEKPDGAIRGWASLTILIGALLVWAAV